MTVMSPPSSPCTVLHCPERHSNPDHQVRTPEDGSGWQPRPVCTTHWSRIDAGEPWLWVPWQRLKGVGSTLSEGCVLMGAELSGYGLIIDADVQVNNDQVFSPALGENGQTPTLSIDGRVFGAGEHIAIELVLTPDTAQRLKEALRFLRP